MLAWAIWVMGSADVFDANTQWSGVCCGREEGRGRRERREGVRGGRGERRKEKIKCS